MPFLPPGYEAPASSSRYLKFQDGDNKFRVLGSAIVGYELWINRKPVRKLTAKDFTREDLERADLDQDGNPSRPRHFWAFPVIDYADTSVKILEVTQKTIQDGIQSLVSDEDWGDPKNYDIVVKRQTVDKKTSYNVIAKPAKALNQDQVSAWEQVKQDGFNLEALFDGADPFTYGVDEIKIDDIDIPE